MSDSNEREDRIREHAYLMWLDDGRPDGRAEKRWHLAARAVVPA